MYCSKTQRPSDHPLSSLWKCNIQWKEWIFGRNSHENESQQIFSLFSVRLAAYTATQNMNILSAKSLSCYATLLPNLGDMNSSGSQITLCCIEDKNLGSCFLCKIIQVIRHSSLRSPSMLTFDRGTWLQGVSTSLLSPPCLCTKCPKNSGRQSRNWRVISCQPQTGSRVASHSKVSF